MLYWTLTHSIGIDAKLNLVTHDKNRVVACIQYEKRMGKRRRRKKKEWFGVILGPIQMWIKRHRRAIQLWTIYFSYEILMNSLPLSLDEWSGFFWSICLTVTWDSQTMSWRLNALTKGWYWMSNSAFNHTWCISNNQVTHTFTRIFFFVRFSAQFTYRFQCTAVCFCRFFDILTKYRGTSRTFFRMRRRSTHYILYPMNRKCVLNVCGVSFSFSFSFSAVTKKNVFIRLT